MADTLGGTSRLPPGMTVGMDTFRGTLGSSLLRATLYEKNDGLVSTDRIGLVRTDSPVSGSLLLSKANVQQAVKDPMTGTTLKFKGARAEVTTPVQKQQLQFSKKFYVTKDVDITVQMLRNTTKVSKYTNEKIGTAGTPTGMDSSMRTFQEIKAAQEQQGRPGLQ